jgi:3-dehydrosphinganine reductase
MAPTRAASARVGHAIISGGSSGIGLALAHGLARAGWDLTLFARNRERLVAARDALIAHGGAVGTHSVDVADAAGVERASAAAIAELGPPALAVACAGIVVPGRLEAQPLEAFQRTMAVNYFGTLHLIRAVLPAMRAERAVLPGMRTERGGRIVLIASGAALIGLYGFSSYAPSKFAVRGLAEALRSELAPEGVAVSVVYPPDTDTPGYREELRHRPEISHRLAATGGLMSAEAVAAAIFRGIARDRFVIAPGASMAALARLHSLAAPLLHRFWFDPLITRLHRRSSTNAHAKIRR